jgi:group I intron endonuclease
MGCLYRLTSPSGKAYIGITSKTADERWSVHQMRVREGRSQAIQKAIRKYGAENFKVETLVIADDWQYLCDLERKAIIAFGTRAPTGYNLTAGGEGVLDRVHTEEAAKNMSAGQLLRQQRPEEREKMKLAAKKSGDIAAEKWAAIRVDGLPKWKREKRDRTLRAGSPELRELISRNSKTAHARPEVAEKVKAAARARAASPEWKAKMSASKKGAGLGRKQSPETIARQAEARRQWWARRKQTNQLTESA